MKKKNGFVFIETMVVIIVLIVSLMVLYTSYTGFMAVERRMARYDDPAFLYKTQMIANFLNNIKDENDDLVLYKLINNISSNYLSITQLDIYMSGTVENKDFYDNIVNDLSIQNAIIIKKDKIDALINSGNFDDDFCRYLKQLQKKSNYNYYLLVSYAEKSNGDKCDFIQLMEEQKDVTKISEAACIRYYASVPINIY